MLGSSEISSSSCKALSILTSAGLPFSFRARIAVRTLLRMLLGTELSCSIEVKSVNASSMFSKLLIILDFLHDKLLYVFGAFLQTLFLLVYSLQTQFQTFFFGSKIFLQILFFASYHYGPDYLINFFFCRLQFLEGVLCLQEMGLQRLLLHHEIRKILLDSL